MARIIRTISIRVEQDQYIKDKKVNLSIEVQKLIIEMMKKDRGKK